MLRPVLCAALMAAVSVSPSYGQILQTHCPDRAGPMHLERADLAKKLADEWGEQVIGAGFVNSDSTVLEVYVNDRTRTWTLVKVYPNGKACVETSGDAWRAVAVGAPT